MVLVGGSAWAQTIFFSQDYEADGATADWIAATNGRFTPVILEEDGNHFLTVDQVSRNNNGTTLTSTSLQNMVEAGTDFTMIFDMKIGSSTNQAPVEFNIYDVANSAKILGLVATGANATTYIVNGNTDQKPAISAGGGKALNALTWMTFQLSRTGALTYLTITNKATSDVVFERALISTLSENGGLGKMEFITKRYNANLAIDNIVVREIQDGDVPAVTPTTYTIKFQDGNGAALKDDVVINTIAGIEVQAAAEHTAAIYANDKKYIYASGNDAITTAEDESSNIITLVFREAATWNYTVNATGAESAIIKQIATGSAFEGDVVSVPYPTYINVEGTLWNKGATNQEYHYNVTLSEENTVANIAYSVTDITDVIYLAEGEEIEGANIFNETNASIRSSNAAAGWTNEPIELLTLPMGKYKASGVIIANSGTPVVSFKLGAREVLSITGSNSNWTAGNAEFVVATDSKLTFVGGNAKSGLDFIYIQSLGQPTSDEVTAAAEADALATAKQQLQDAITDAQAIETEGKEGVDELNKAISDAQNALAAEDATVQTLTDAKNNLADAVDAFNIANSPAFDPSTAIVNANFDADDVVTGKICTYAKDVQEGDVANMQPLTGWTIVENGDARAAGVFAYGSTAILGGDEGNVPTVGPNGETEGKVLGIEAVWSATTQYTQDITLPAGEYLFEAAIYNAAGTGALASNLIGIDGNYCTTKSYPVGKWTEELIKFTLTEEKTVTVSLGVNSGNVGNGSAPHLFIDHVRLYGSDEIAAKELENAKEDALAKIEALNVGDELFLYNEDAVEAAKTAVNAAETVEAVETAVAAALAAMNKPDADKEYIITNATANLALNIATDAVTIAQEGVVKFTEVEGGWVLSNNAETPEYILKTSANNWTFSTTTNMEEAYVVNFNLADGAYTIQGAKGLFGTDNAAEGSTVYANKTQANNGLWTIAEKPAEPVIEPAYGVVWTTETSSPKEETDAEQNKKYIVEVPVQHFQTLAKASDSISVSFEFLAPTDSRLRDVKPGHVDLYVDAELLAESGDIANGQTSYDFMLTAADVEKINAETAQQVKIVYSENIVLKSIEFKEAVTPEAPTFSVEEGTYTTAQTVEISCATEGADIYYTIDGTEPTTSSLKYTEAISIETTTTLKAIAVVGTLQSEVTSATYTIKNGTVGISAINAGIKNGQKAYNMNGQEVKSVKKGLYIVNGKKTVVK